MLLKFKIIIVILPAILLLLFTGMAKAQYLSLNKTELQKLVALIKADASAHRLYTILEEEAKLSLKQQPDPIDTIVSEGHLNTDPQKIITQRCLGDMDKIYALAYTYKISREPVYLKKCTSYIIAWAKVNHAIGNPINNTKLEPLFEAYDLIKDEIGAADKAGIETWLAKVADSEIGVLNSGSTKKVSFNNWNSHRIKVVGCIAYILNNKAYQLYTDTNIKKQIFKNLYANGSGIDFEDRDALHYHIYTLEPLLRIAAVIKRATGVDYFTYVSPSGSSIQKSVAFLVPYVTGEKQHQEYVNTKAAFDKKRADNNEAAFKIGAAFKPETAIDVMGYAAWFKPEYTTIVKKLLDIRDSYPNWQAVLNAVKK